METVFIWIGGILATGGVLRGLWGFFKLTSNAYQWIKEIHYQLTPNAGQSLSDIIHRGELNDAILHRNIESVYGVVLKMHSIDPEDAPLLEVLAPPSGDLARTRAEEYADSWPQSPSSMPPGD